MARDNDIGGVATRETEVFREADRGATGGTAAGERTVQETESKLAELEARGRALLDRAQPHGWLDAPRGTKASGSRFVYRLGDFALLEMALYRYAFTRVTEQGHIPMLPPVLVREEAMYGTGFFPTDAVSIYGVESDQLYLVGTSEVPAAGFHARETPRSRP